MSCALDPFSCILSPVPHLTREAAVLWALSSPGATERQSEPTQGFKRPHGRKRKPLVYRALLEMSFQ